VKKEEEGESETFLKSEQQTKIDKNNPFNCHTLSGSNTGPGC